MPYMEKSPNWTNGPCNSNDDNKIGNNNGNQRNECQCFRKNEHLEYKCWDKEDAYCEECD